MSGVAVTAAGSLTGGSGNDTATVTAATTGTTAFGNGNDTVTVTTVGANGSVDGGNGTGDVLVLTGTSAAAADADATFNTAVTNFEKLNIITDAGANVDLSVLTYDHVIVGSGAADAGATVSLIGAGASTTVEIKGIQGTQSVALDDATGSADSITIIASGSDSGGAGAAAALAVGTVTANAIETVNLQSTTADADGAADSTMTLAADAATTVNVSGANGLNLTLNAASVAVVTVNASTMTGDLTVAGLSTTTNITGGTGADVIETAAASATLVGGAGNDQLSLSATSTLSTLTGGDGNDTFTIDVAVASTAYSTITDLSSGDILDAGAATATDVFNTAAVTLAGNSTFAQYLDAAVAQTAVTVNTAINHFQFGGNTYVVVDNNDGAGADTATYTDAEDTVVEITGLVDLSTAAFNLTSGDLIIA